MYKCITCGKYIDDDTCDEPKECANCDPYEQLLHEESNNERESDFEYRIKSSFGTKEPLNNENNVNFTAIDFETANKKKSSALSIGIAVVKAGEIVHTEHHLIKPRPFKFIPEFQYLHGITKDMVINEPEFDVIWERVKPHIVNAEWLVAYNAEFDFEVLANALLAHNIPIPRHLKFICPMDLARQFLDTYNYKMATVCEHLGIDIDGHHNAAKDAVAVAKIMLYFCNLTKCLSIDELASSTYTTPITLQNLAQCVKMKWKKRIIRLRVEESPSVQPQRRWWRVLGFGFFAFGAMISFIMLFAEGYNNSFLIVILIYSLIAYAFWRSLRR